MEFTIKEVRIRELIDWIKNDKIDLKPSYQRNDMWNKNDQKLLIDSILNGYPLPNFFTYERPNGHYEMVDGQQRARTIFRFFNNKISGSHKTFYKNINKEKDFLDYVLNFTEIYNVANEGEIEKFYVLVNKRGKHLTTPEINKAEYSNTNFLNLVEDLLEYQNIIELNLFSEASSKRMNDRNFIEELTSYLLKGIRDKKEVIEEIYRKDITNTELETVKAEFKKIIDRIKMLNDVHRITSTRYKQRNDFYTLFNFIHQNFDESDRLLLWQYNILILIGPYISPSNMDCQPLREYAIHCVSQSNSKNAREKRLEIFNNILLNKDDTLKSNFQLADVAEYLETESSKEIKFEYVDNYYLINPHD